jgi:uncharacterized repeat protein (TIGR03803 family)
MALLIGSVLSAPLFAQGYQDLFEFDGTHGCCPAYPNVMAQGTDGNLYGTTPTGGANNVGAVFRMTPSGAITVIYSFDVTHGSEPNGGLILGADGNFYGTTEFGGANAEGTIFKITPGGALVVLYSFAALKDGKNPLAPLAQGTDGNLYGSSYPGVAFKISTAGKFVILSNSLPTTPYGALVQASDGAFYGTAPFGGAGGAGALFKLAGTKVTTLFSFDNLHGTYPYAGLALGNDGLLYGATTAGGANTGGTVFKATTAGVVTVLYSFDIKQTAGGYQAFAGLVPASDGNLFGATVFGGGHSAGATFEITTAGAYTQLSGFDGTHGAGAYATPMQHTSGEFFGFTKRGGTPGKGIAYGVSSGAPPFAKLMLTTGPVGKSVGILGIGLSHASSVQFNGTPASFHVINDYYLTSTVPSGETGFITVSTASGTLISNRLFRVTPRITAISPLTGPVGSNVVLTGTGLIQASNITVGGVRVASYTVNSDKQVTITVPAGAKTGKIVMSTPGGKTASVSIFTVM